jgi:hypothetical protein
MKPFIHAVNSARKFGGIPEDYISIHNFFDWTKSTIGDIRHRVILHNTFGAYLAEKLFGYPEAKIINAAQKFGWTEEEIQAIKDLIDEARSNDVTTITNSDNKRVQIRDVAEQHIIEDMGCIPTVGDCLHLLPVHGWLRTEITKIIKHQD